MTNRQAIAADIEPYSLSDESIEKSFLDAAMRFGIIASADDEYTPGMKKLAALASMLCLNRLRVLENENIGGISQSFNVKKLEKRIEAIAYEAGLSPELVLASDDENSITFIPCW